MRPPSKTSQSISSSYTSPFFSKHILLVPSVGSLRGPEWRRTNERAREPHHGSVIPLKDQTCPPASPPFPVACTWLFGWNNHSPSLDSSTRNLLRYSRTCLISPLKASCTNRAHGRTPAQDIVQSHSRCEASTVRPPYSMIFSAPCQQPGQFFSGPATGWHRHLVTDSGYIAPAWSRTLALFDTMRVGGGSLPGPVAPHFDRCAKHHQGNGGQPCH
jgi:hypothetical protein